MAQASVGAQRRLLAFWPFWARPEQTPPHGAWRTWLFLGGRGAGKTRAGAEWITAEVEAGRFKRVALVGPALADVREVMIEGPSGLAAIRSRSARPRYQPSRRRLIWPNGAVGYAFSAEDPDSLRGPQFDGAWLDELAAWPDAQKAFDMLQFGLRLGSQPRQAVTTTPRPIQALRRLLSAPETAVTYATSFANAANLAPGFLKSLQAAYGGSLLARQEILGELIDEVGGGLWPRALIERSIAPPPALERIVVGVDPPAGEGPRSVCGIVVAGAVGRGEARCAWVLADRSVRGAGPIVWAQRVVDALREFKAERIVAETNQGGAMVRALLRIVDPSVEVTEVRAVHGKRARAEPVLLLYERDRVRHAGGFPLLEDEMCTFGAPGLKARADRVDALVWAVTALMRDETPPRLRRL